LYPYDFAPERNLYFFLTEFGWVYTVSFRESADYFRSNKILFNDSLVFEISFSRSAQNAGKIKRGGDDIVKETILNILIHHFDKNGQIPIYFLFVLLQTKRKQQD